MLVEMNAAMQERSRAAAEAGVADLSVHVEVDFNSWTPHERVDVALASHSLYHVTDLEHLFDALHGALAEDGIFLISDIVGRNGHLRWPEAADVVRRLWRVVPPHWRYNHQFHQEHEHFDDWDCSGESFEGVRAQDILPLLLERFHPGPFLGFAKVIDVFVDRGYGPNVYLDDESDLRVLREIAELDEQLIDLGLVTPTHILACFHRQPVEQRYVSGRSAQRCVRPTSVVDLSGQKVVPERTPEAAVVAAPLMALGAMHGRHPDGWAGAAIQVDLMATGDVAQIVLEGYLPPALPEQVLTCRVDGREVHQERLAKGPFQLRFASPVPAGSAVRLEVLAGRTFSPSDSGGR